MKTIESMSEVASSGTSLTYIGTSWCQFCHKTTKALAEVMPTVPDVEVLHVDGDDVPDILSEIGSKTYPQLLLHKDGRLVAQRESADAATLREWLSEHGVS